MRRNQKSRLATRAALAIATAAIISLAVPAQAEEEKTAGGKLVTIGNAGTGGVKILRGPGSKKATKTVKESTGSDLQTANFSKITSAGRTLWFIDQRNRRLMACQIIYTSYVNGSRIGCTSRAID
jgi:uncharacterized membrane protein